MTILRTWRGVPIKRRTEAGVVEKRCPRCEVWKPHGDEHFQFLPSRGHYQSQCRQCISAAQVAWVQRRRMEAQL